MSILEIPALQALKAAAPAPEPPLTLGQVFAEVGRLEAERQADPEKCDLHEIALSLGPPPPFDYPNTEEFENQEALDVNAERRALVMIEGAAPDKESLHRRRVTACCPACLERTRDEIAALPDDALLDKVGAEIPRDHRERVVASFSSDFSGQELYARLRDYFVQWLTERASNHLVVDWPGDWYDARQLRDTLRARCLAGCAPTEIAQTFEKWISEQDALVLRIRAERDARESEERRRVILDAWSIDKLAPAGDVAGDPVVDGILYARNMTMVYGTRGSRKTMSLIARAICVAAGIPWLGRPVRQGLAVLVLQEGDRAQLLQWIERIARGLGIDLKSLRDQLIVYPADLRVDVDDSWEAFRSRIEALGPTFVGLDNLTRLRAKATGNGANDPAINAALMDRLEGLARSRPAVELLHHANAHGDPLGSQVPGNVADLEFRIVAASADNQSVVTMRLGAKQRVGSALSEIRFRFRDRDDGAIVPELAARDISEAPADDEPARRRETLLTLLDPAGLTAEELYQAAPWTRRVTQAVRDQLEADRIIVKLGGRWRRA